MNISTLSFQLQGSKFQRGFTLVELMIAMGIGTFISAGVIALFIGNNRGYDTNEALARVQENGRFAIEHLARDIRQAGSQNFNVIASWPATDYIQGWQGATSTPSGAPIATYTPRTDVVRITYYDISIPTPATVNHTYFIGPGTDFPGLRRRVNLNPAQELIENVYDMQVRYGLDSSGDGEVDTYVSSTSDWNNVLAVKIDLLVGSTENNVVETPMSLPFERNDGTFFTATDRRVYQMFSTTIALRSRIK